MATIVIVDDERIILGMIAALVEELGHRALVATNGRDALALIQNEPERPALVISDIMMPHLNGVALAHALKTHPRFQSVPIVLMSAAYHSHFATMADHFLPKPFDIEDIERLIEQHVGAPVERPEPLKLPDMGCLRVPEYQLPARR